MDQTKLKGGYMNKPLVNKRNLRQWVIGSYLQFVSDDIIKIEKKDIKKATEYADEVMLFLESNYLLSEHIK